MSEVDPYADVDPAVFAPDAEPASSFPSADELPESNTDMWNPAPGEVPGTGGMLFPDAPDAQAPVAAAAPSPGTDSPQGPPEGWEVIDADGKPTGHDAYGNPVEPTPFEPAPQSEPPEGWEVIDADGKGTGRDAYGNPLEPTPFEPAPPQSEPPEGWEVIDADGKGTGRDAYGNPVPPPEASR